MTSANFGKVHNIYIHISPALQAQMVASPPVRVEYTLQTGHTPFLTDPDGLANAIEQTAQ